MTQEKTLMVVDDEDLLRAGLAKFLMRKGFRVVQADGGNAALEMIRANGVDLIISDVRMGRGSGIDLVKNMRASGILTPVIFMTGFSEASPEELIGLGARNVLSKPLDRVVLLNLIAEILS